MKPLLTLLSFVVLTMGPFEPASAQDSDSIDTENVLKAEIKKLPKGMFDHKGGGSASGGGGKKEKSVHIINKCGYAVDYTVFFRNKSGDYSAGGGLNKERSGWIGSKASRILDEKCKKKKSSKKCPVFVKSKKRIWQITTCR